VPRNDALHAARLTAQLLAGDKVGTPEAVVERVLAVQGQDPRGFRLAIRARSAGLSAADVDSALTDRRSLVVTWLNRGTLHLVRAEDYWWLHPLTTPQLTTGSETRLRQEGVSPIQAERGVEIIAAEVARGPRTRDELRDALDNAGIVTAGQATYHLLFLAALRGDLVRGPMRGNEQAFVGAVDWLGPAPEPLERSEALATLALRYLAGHGPAAAQDLAKWAGITLRDARAGLAAGDGVVEISDGLFGLADREQPAPIPSPRLLGPFDPLLLGWASRADVVGLATGLVTNNGLFRPFAMVGGRAVATWGLAGGKVEIKLFEPIKVSAQKALMADARDVLRYLSLPDADGTCVLP
jgi:hypothetical protein